MADPVIYDFMPAGGDDSQAASAAPAQQSHSYQGAPDTIAGIENLMRTDRNAYNRDVGMQARLRELYAERGPDSGRQEPLSNDPATRVNQMMAAHEQAEWQELDADQPMLDLPGHDYQVPPELARDELVQYATSLSAAAGLPAETMASILASKHHGGQLSRDDSDRDSGLAELRNLWGPSTDAKLDMVRGYIANNLPPNIAEALHGGARMSDGRALLNSPEILITLASMAQKGIRLPSGDAASIQRAMGTRAYASDVGAQLRYHWLQRKGGRK